MAFSDTLWRAVLPVYEAILLLPFNTELAAGTLKVDKFRYYLQQDALYIKAYARALALLAAKAPEQDVANELLTYARDGVAIEQLMHEHFFKAFHIEPIEEPQPACLSYMSFLIATAAIEPFETGLAAILPCFWIYREAGQVVAKNNTRSDNPFQKWIDTYQDSQFSKDVDSIILTTNRAAETASNAVRQQMIAAFVTSTRLEYNFWNAAWNLEKWKL